MKVMGSLCVDEYVRGTSADAQSFNTLSDSAPRGPGARRSRLTDHVLGDAGGQTLKRVGFARGASLHNESVCRPSITASAAAAACSSSPPPLFSSNAFRAIADRSCAFARRCMLTLRAFSTHLLARRIHLLSGLAQAFQFLPAGQPLASGYVHERARWPS